MQWIFHISRPLTFNRKIVVTQSQQHCFQLSYLQHAIVRTLNGFCISLYKFCTLMNCLLHIFWCEFEKKNLPATVSTIPMAKKKKYPQKNTEKHMQNRKDRKVNIYYIIIFLRKTSFWRKCVENEPKRLSRQRQAINM